MYKITFKESPNKYLGRSGYQPIAIVNHRMVGYLSGTDITFASSSSGVSAHFGIGYSTTNTVRISQYVDLSDSAWTAGNYDASGGWTLVKKTSTGTVINPNRYIVGIEHEDGGPDDGRVSDAVKEASVWLQSILLSGNIDLMRFVGIQVRDEATAVALGQIQEGPETIIDHNRISGKLKPYCWRPYKLDTGGFPAWQPKLIEQLRGSTMAIQDTLNLLAQQVAEVEAQKLTAQQETFAAQESAKQALARLSLARTKAQEIQTSVNQIAVLASDIIGL